MSAGSGFVTVSKDMFFATVGPMNVHPRCERERTFWETPSRQIVGISTPGYLSTGPTTYLLCAAIAKAEARP